jgi:hypothetical protein
MEKLRNNFLRDKATSRKTMEMFILESGKKGNFLVRVSTSIQMGKR